MISTADFVMKTVDWKTIINNVFGNIIMFTPFGFLGIIFPKLNDFKTLIINFLSAIIIIESLQYFTRLSVFDIDDIILNLAGCMIGFALGRMSEKVKTLMQEKKKERNEESYES